jgi:hypothetical protein
MPNNVDGSTPLNSESDTLPRCPDSLVVDDFDEVEVQT